MQNHPDPDPIAVLRTFNRDYTRKLGVLDQHIYDSPFSLAEARVIYEIANGEPALAKNISHDLKLDTGYVSRIVNALIERALVARKVSPGDRRQQHLLLTAKGRVAFGKLVLASERDAGAWLAELGPGNGQRAVEAMAMLSKLLTGRPAPVMLRAPRPGDMGWVVQSHGALYAAEYGFGPHFEALVAEVVASFVRGFDGRLERCWIADQDGKPVGSVFVVKQSDQVAQLRLLLVDPAARGQKLGQRLVDESIAFARACGYRKLVLWTQSILIAARGIYKGAGFVKTGEESRGRFGTELIGETWELVL